MADHYSGVSGQLVRQGQMQADFVRSIVLDLVLTLITCGLFNLWVQHRQMQAVNIMIGERRYKFLHWAIFTLITCGLYHIYHEYRKSSDIARALGDEKSLEPVINIVLTAFGLSVVADAIQQAHINRFFGSNAL